MSEQLEIIGYSPDLSVWFEQLNLEWLEEYFVVEAIDRKVLQNPEREILEHGGRILFARYRDAIVGTCAIKHHGEGNYELTKMAVSNKVQGRGFGRTLLQAAIAEYHKLSGTQLYLESHHTLGPALKLYESGGFVHAPPPPGPRPYERSDIYMILQD